MMAKPSRRTLTVTAAALAIGAGILTWAATSASAATAAAVIPKCSPGQLDVWVSPNSANAAAGTGYYHLDFTNVSGSTCHLYGYPGVSAVNSAGKQLGVPARRNANVPVRDVNIAPNGTAHAVVGYVDAQLGSGCPHTAATFLKVYPPDDTGSRNAWFPLQVCTNNAVDLTIDAVQAGA
jgi:hypothetical protein